MSRSIITMDERTIKTIWPYNLAYAVYDDLNFAVCIDPKALIDITDKDLNERESKLIHLYYENGMTYDEIANEIERTRERVRQVIAKGLRKLKHPSRSNCYSLQSWTKLSELIKENESSKKEIAVLKLEYANLEDRIKKFYGSEEYQKFAQKILIEEFMDSYIDILELSVRAYNCLTRYSRRNLDKQYMTVKELTSMTLEDVQGIKNIGQRTIEEILYRLNYYELGLKDMNWDQYQEMIKKGEI